MSRIRSVTLPVMAGLALASAVPLAMGAASATAAASGSGRLVLSSAQGAVLQTRGGFSLLQVRCAGAAGARCVGRVRLLPRGAATRRLVGSAPIASRSVNLAARADKQLRVALSPRSRRALARNVLAVTVALSSRGSKRPATSRAVVASFARDLGSSRPTGVLTSHPVQGGVAVTVKAFTWKWDIPVRHYLVLPQFDCPSDAPNVATSGAEIQHRKTGERLGLKAKLDVVAKSGTGYAGFDVPTVKNYAGKRGDYPDYKVMTGWPKGGFAFNSIWAPVLFEDGHFELTVTCTSSTNRDQIAYANSPVKDEFIFPWVS